MTSPPLDTVNEISGARGAAKSTQRVRAPGMKTFFWLILGGGLLLGSVVTWKAILHVQPKENKPQERPTKIVNSLPPLALPAENLRAHRLVEPAKEEAQSSHAMSHTSDPLTVRRLSGGFGEGEFKNSTQISTQSVSANEVSSPNSGLASQLHPLQLKPQSAGVLGNRDYLITRGTLISCALQTRLDSDVAGMVACYTTEDVYSDNGRVVLLDRGSKITGQYESGLQRGQARIFVTWQRLETPEGVIIDLDSPGTDPLGGSGMPGIVDEHFRQRFGSAILFSILQDAGQIAANLTTRAVGNTTISLGNTSQSSQDLVGNELQRAMTIKSTLYKNQGERIAIFVARDLCFESVYGLQATSLKTHYPPPQLPIDKLRPKNTCVDDACSAG